MKKRWLSLLLCWLVPLFAGAADTFPPSSTPVIAGMDVSAWQGAIDWQSVARSGEARVAYIRATEGARYVDAYFARNYAQAKRSGLDVGFYHFLTAQTPQEAVAQARFFVDTLQSANAVADCRPAMDLEGDERMSDATWNAVARAFLSEVERLTGETPCIYCDASGARDRYDESLTSYPLWVANYGVALPEANGKWRSWAGFQYTDRGRMPGVAGQVDLDQFTQEIYLAAPAPTPAPTPHPESAAAYYAVQPGDTASAVAARYGVLAQDVAEWNLIPRAGLLPGQVLRIPAAATEAQTQAGSLFVSPNRTRPIYTALHFDVPLADLTALNVFPEENRVLRGQVLRIPVRTAFALPDTLLDNVYIAQRREGLRRAADAFGVPVADLAAFNGLQPDALLWPGQIIHLTRFGVPTESRRFYGAYVVQKGDTLTRIARRFDTSVDALTALNDLPDKNRLVIGQVLLLP